MKVGRKRVDRDAASRTIATASIAALLVAALAGGGAGCSGPGKTFTKSMVLGGKKVSARRLNNGEHLFVTYCSACHGVNGDGKGPASIGLRPPPRNFTQGEFKFGAVASGQLPNDEDFMRIIQKGLHGSAMLPWNDVPERELMDIIQYIKTLSPKWADKTPGEPIVPGPDTRGKERRDEAVTRGMKVYHGLAQCLSCHPAHETPETLEDIYRTSASGIGGTAMPTWRGALSDDDLWAMAYYVRSLIDVKGTPEADARREKLVAALAGTSHED